jgi:hypothetical protein
MADKAISELVAAEQIKSTDMFVLEQDGTAKRLQGQTLLNWLTAAADGHGGISNIAKTGADGLVDTYTITLADTTTKTFTVTNGNGLTAFEKLSTVGLVDTYRFTRSDGTYFTFAVANGAKGDTGEASHVWIKYASQQPTASSHSMGDLPDAWMGVYSGTAAEAPDDWQQYTWYQIKGEKGDPGASATVTGTTVEYMVSDSGTIVPSGSWSTTIPTVPQGKYLWTKVTTTFNTGSPAVSYSVTRMGIDGGEVFYIDLEGDYPNYTCPVALADINAAYEAGKVLECRCKMGMYTATLPLFIPVPELGRWIFSGSGELADMGFPAQALTVAVTSRGVQASNAKLATTEDKLPNPYALTITSGSNSVTYDGSAPKSIDIPAGPKGDKGDPGAKGEKGDPGLQGPAGAVYSPNLLRNGTFADGCIVNQRGKTSYAGTGYGVDMWYTTGATLSVDVTAEGVKLYKNAASANPAWAQALETDAAVGQTVTVSMLYKGNGEGASLRVAQSGGIVTLSNVSDWTLAQKTFALEKWSVGTLQDRAIVAIQCFENMAANQGLYIKAIKLELGEQQTLAHQENGAWVLNELPDYGGELLRCQRYYQVYTTAAARPAKALDCRPVMRTDPAQSTVSVGGATLYANSAEL